MKRLIILLLALSLTSCSYIGATQDILISSPPTQQATSLSENVSDLSDVSDTTDNSPTANSVEPNGASLTLNTNSKKIHYYDTCSYAKRIKDANKSTVPHEQLTSLLADGYSVCSWCEKQNEKS